MTAANWAQKWVFLIKFIWEVIKFMFCELLCHHRVCGQRRDDIDRGAETIVVDEVGNLKAMVSDVIAKWDRLVQTIPRKRRERWQCKWRRGRRRGRRGVGLLIIVGGHLYCLALSRRTQLGEFVRMIAAESLRLTVATTMCSYSTYLLYHTGLDNDNWRKVVIPEKSNSKNKAVTEKTQRSKGEKKAKSSRWKTRVNFQKSQ